VFLDASLQAAVEALLSSVRGGARDAVEVLWLDMLRGLVEPPMAISGGSLQWLLDSQRWGA
jgi:hypothetical protein